MGETDTSERMNQSEYARHRGVSSVAVGAAIRKGRLKKSVGWDERGKAYIANVKLADQEWVAGRDLSTTPQDVRDLIEAADARVEGKPLLNEPPPDVSKRITREEEGEEPDPNDEDVEADDEDDLFPDGEEVTMNQAQTTEKMWRARLVRLQYREKAGELVEAKEVGDKLADVFTTCRTKLLGLAARAKQRLPHLTNEDVAELDTLVREALEDLAGGK